MPVRYRRLVFGIESGDPELLAAALWERGTLGVELVDEPAPGRLIAYFGDPPPGPESDWSRYGARLLTSEEYDERDWMAVYRERARPLAVGSQLWVDPGEPQGPLAAPAGGRHLLRLPARTAFGTGGHESTRLVVEALEALDVKGRSVLDVGTGSGILSFVALFFGAARVVGVEVDLGAALVAAQNRRLNGLFPQFVAGGVEALDPAHRFDLALVNVLPERIAPDLGRLRRLLRPRATAIFSGILTDRRREAGARLAREGFGRRRWLADGEWSALVAGVGE